ncbi:thioredoxin family protein [Aliiroseovarius sp. KMU-50]|uniref:Thioredoxin family protein n=1 Tax=Aliiroseovarius salicola TaxID=3009082 RepID=A0ABT4W227_9RHOB|nr:thioredoxin family protein [Aliiroseovarius sp. KMU-50]MDA5094536.1 thioredoxin family protein [Aliiroseovarius sp. KMU-50]
MDRIIYALTLVVLSFLPLEAAEMGDDGLYLQPFFTESFFELVDDLTEAQEAGKDLMVIFEQKGCPYCREMHLVNFEREEIINHLTENFLVVQLNLWGSREVTDFEGVVWEERELAASWGVNFTPTVLMFSLEDGTPSEVFRMPGYFKPFHFLKSLEFVSSDAYETQVFQRYLQDRFQELADQGLTPDVW